MAYFVRYLREIFQHNKDKNYITLKIYHLLWSMRHFYITFQLRVSVRNFKEESRLQVVNICLCVIYRKEKKMTIGRPKEWRGKGIWKKGKEIKARKG
jgi:hypothetical protein